MADVTENSLEQKNDCAFVRALDANGNSIRISKADLASVVAGLLGNVGFTENRFLDSNNARNLLDYVGTGICRCNFGSDLPEGITYAYGILLTIHTSAGSVQLFFHNGGSYLTQRRLRFPSTFGENAPWTAWKTI